MNTRKSVSHEQAIELLPWLVNGSMGAEEKENVREHALTCVICRRELEELERLRDSIAGAAESRHIPAPDMRNINARIDGQSRRWEMMSWLRDTIFNPWRLAFAAQTGLVIVLAAVLLWPGSEDPEFTTLTQPQNIPDGHYVRVVFSPDLTASDLSGLLDEMRLTVADGPSARGVYTLGISQTMSEDDRARLLENLQREPNVLFARRVVLQEN